MKNLFLASVALFSTAIFAIDLGTLDTSFSNDGWDRTGINGYDRFGSAIAVDSQKRILVAGADYYDNNGQTDLTVLVQRYLPSGVLDNTFNSQSIINFAQTPEQYSVNNIKIELDNNDGFFLAYSYNSCAAGTNCKDVIVYHFDSNGSIIDLQDIAFDLGPDADSINDQFNDISYIPDLNKLAIGVTVDVLETPYWDTDFGIALLNVGQDGSLSLDTSFDADGKNTCSFNQAPVNASQDDSVFSIAFNSAKNSIIVGGTSWEGNGSLNSGVNMSFCEFKIITESGQSAGSVLEQWSTQSLPDNPFSDDKEDLRSLSVTSNGSVIAAGMVTGSGGVRDFAVLKYNFNGTDWIIDSSFGPFGTGWATAGFELVDSNFNLIHTDDTVTKLFIESEDGSLLIGGFSRWNDPTIKSSGALIKFNNRGLLETNWGQNRSGKSLIDIDNNSENDIFSNITEDPSSESIFAIGDSFDQFDYKRIVAKFHNDQIFGSNFEF